MAHLENQVKHRQGLIRDGCTVSGAKPWALGGVSLHMLQTLPVLSHIPWICHSWICPIHSSKR